MEGGFLRQRLFLFVLPLCTLVLSCIFLNKFYPFFLSQPDPCYSYLFNGTNLASGHLEIGHIDHPGTTVQCFAAAVIFIKHLFTGAGTSITKDVIVNAESYLLMCSAILSLIFVIVNYLAGAYIFRHTANLGLAMLFQITPLINVNIVQRAIVLDSESILIIAAMFFIAYLFIRTINNEERFNNRRIIIFSLFSALLIASKYTCVPVIFLVMFTLKDNRQRLLYLSTTIVAFFIFIIPALPKIGDMFHWISGLATHQGAYGRGEKGFANTSEFFNNLSGIILTDAVFSAIYTLITIAFAYAVIQKINRKNVPLFRLITGVWVSITVLILAVAKHDEFHYLVYAECCFPLGLAVSYMILKEPIIGLWNNYKKYQHVALYSFFGVLCVFLVIEKIRYMPLHHPKWAGVNEYIDKYQNLPLVISVKDGLACERQEPALYLGYMYSGNEQDSYASLLNKQFPATYIYWYDSKQLVHWNSIVRPQDVILKNGALLVYTKGYNEATRNNIMRQLQSDSLSGNVGYSEQQIFNNSETLQRLSIITQKKL